MMTPDPDRLYKLLPAVYRQRDYEGGGPLKALLAVITEQVNVVDQDITQLYANWFIETCEEWAVPYIGDLIGYQSPVPASLPDDASSPGGQALEGVLIPRREVANTLSYRRRKGTLRVVQDQAGDLTGWPARSEELDRRFAIAQALNHLRPERGRLIDLRSRGALDRLGGAFDNAGRTVRLRGIGLAAGKPSETLPCVGLFVWRLKVYAFDRVPACCLEEAGDRCYTFSTLANDVPLYARGDPSGASQPGAVEADFPGPIRRGEFAQAGPRGHADVLCASPDYYGAGKSVAVWAPGWCGLDPGAPVPADRVVPADLSQWRYEPPRGHIAVDPELGRIAFPPGELPKGGVWVSYCYAFSDNLGGGPYPRQLAYPTTTPVYLVGRGAQYSSIGSALEAWENDAPAQAIVEIVDSEVYPEAIRIKLVAHQSLEVRASSGARPVIDLLDWHANRPDALSVSGEEGSQFQIEGIVIEGRALEIKGALTRFAMRHCTLVPGWSLRDEPRRRRGGEPSLVLIDTAARISIVRSIVGALRVIRTEAGLPPSPGCIEGSIVDATGPEAIAVGGDEGARVAAIALTIRTSTILGKTRVHAIDLAENTLFTDEVQVARRQQGCMRFCYAPFESRTPRRYQCQPDLVEQAMAQSLRAGHEPEEVRATLLSAERHRVKPDFVSTLYGAPGYGRLADRCAREIRRGAEDGSELGVFHDLFEPQRLDMLIAMLAGSVDAGARAEVIFAD